MESPSNRTLKTAEEIRESCAANKGLGLSNAERWSGSKQLVEFIDDLLSGRRRAKAKLAQPVRLVLQACYVLTADLSSSIFTFAMV